MTTVPFSLSLTKKGRQAKQTPNNSFQTIHTYPNHTGNVGSILSVGLFSFLFRLRVPWYIMYYKVINFLHFGSKPFNSACCFEFQSSVFLEKARTLSFQNRLLMGHSFLLITVKQNAALVPHPLQLCFLSLLANPELEPGKPGTQNPN